MAKRAKNDGEEEKKSKKQKVEEEVDEVVEDDEGGDEVVIAKKDKKKDKKNKKDKKKAVEEAEEEEEAPVSKKDKKKSKKQKKEEEEDEEDEEEDSGFTITKPQPTLNIKGPGGKSSAPAASGGYMGKTGGGSFGSSAPKQFESDSPMIYVNGFPYSYTEDEVRTLFGTYGEITEIYLPTFQDNPEKLRGFGFVTYSTSEAAKKSLELNGTDLNGRTLRVEPKMVKEGGGGGDKGGKPSRYEDAKPLSNTPPAGCDTVFCGNLDFGIQDEDMHTFFKDCGEIQAIRWGEDRETKRFKGFGFIQFKNTAAVIAAGKLNGQKLKGRQIKIDYQKPRE